jgi:hypothetical protein
VGDANRHNLFIPAQPLPAVRVLLTGVLSAALEGVGTDDFGTDGRGQMSQTHEMTTVSESMTYGRTLWSSRLYTASTGRQFPLLLA